MTTVKNLEYKCINYHKLRDKHSHFCYNLYRKTVRADSIIVTFTLDFIPKLNNNGQ